MSKVEPSVTCPPPHVPNAAVYTMASPVPGTSVMMTQPGVPQHGATFRYRNVQATVQCQFCRATVTTTITFHTGAYTYIFCLLLLVFGVSMGCCLIPFLLDSCKDVTHTCPNCNKPVGHFKRQFGTASP